MLLISITEILFIIEAFAIEKPSIFSQRALNLFSKNSALCKLPLHEDTVRKMPFLKLLKNFGTTKEISSESIKTKDLLSINIPSSALISFSATTISPTFRPEEG